jgi:photosystem II stability/assembly factor-like uncharacterized protein
MQHRYMTRLFAFVSFASASAYLALSAAPPRDTYQLNVDSFSNSVSSHEVLSLFFLDANHGWMTATDHGTEVSYVLRTQDGGQSWQKFETLSGMRQLYFNDANQGWGLRWSGRSNSPDRRIDLVSTKDGGEHWASVSPEAAVGSTEQTHEFAMSMAFSSQSEGWLVGEGPGQRGFIFHTVDAGRTFTRPKGLPDPLSNCFGVYASPKTGVLIFGLGFVLRSTDEGRTWTSPIDTRKWGISELAFIASSAKFLSDGRGWLAGQAGGGAILATRNSGASWRIEFEDKEGTIFEDLWLKDAKRRCAVGNSTLLFCTDDDGLAWSSKNVLPPQSTGQSRIFRRIVLLDSGKGWVVRFGGYLYGTTDGGQIWHALDPLDMATEKPGHV